MSSIKSVSRAHAKPSTRTRSSNTNSPKKIGRQLAIVRKQWLLMLQAQLAIALGCSVDHVSRVERGITEYTLSQILIIEKLAGASISTLLEIEKPANAAWMSEYSELSPHQRAIFDSLAKEALKLTK